MQKVTAGNIFEITVLLKLKYLINLIHCQFTYTNSAPFKQINNLT